MIKHARMYLYLLVLLVVCGCGHSVLIESKLTGLGVILPVGEGQTIGVVLGSMESTTATVRGGTTVETTSVAGGGIFSGEAGVNHITKMKTNAQLNEGNLRDILMSPDCPEAVKVELAKNLSNAAAAPETPPTVVQAQTAAIHSGSEAVTSSNAVPIINRITGVDNLVNQVTDAATTVTGQITGTVTDITNNTVDSVQEGTTGMFDSITKWFRNLKWTWIFKAIALALMGLIAYMFFKNDKDIKSPVLRNADPSKMNPTNGDTPIDPSNSEPAGEPEIIIPPQEEKQEEEKKTDGSKKKKWYTYIFSILTSIIQFVIRMPKEKREKLFKKIKEFFTRKKSKK